MNACTPTPGCCDSDADCDDSDTCTTDVCNLVTNTCVNTPDCTADTDCDDGNVCTEDTCGPPMGGNGCCTNTPECVVDTDCYDGDMCTIDTCVAGCCQYAPDPVCEACCLFDGTCVSATHDDCACLYGGIPQGPGSDCDTAVCPVSWIWTGLNVDIHQDNPDVIANDFHIEGIIESSLEPVLVDQVNDLFPNFSYSIWQGKPQCPTGSIFWCFEANWDGAEYPYCTILHLGLLFEVVCHNVMIDLVGWWTVDGVPVGGVQNVGPGVPQPGQWPLLGFDVTDNIPDPVDPLGQNIRLKNGRSPVASRGGGARDWDGSIEIVEMNLVSIGSSGKDGIEALLGDRPLAELRLGGMQDRLDWVPVVDATGLPISGDNPIPMQPGDVIIVILYPGPGQSRGVPSYSANPPIEIPPGGYLVAKQLVKFMGNGGGFDRGGGGCMCDADVNGNGTVSVADLNAVLLCDLGDCSQCATSCDVNCDGGVNQGDVDAVLCMMQFNDPGLCCPAGQEFRWFWEIHGAHEIPEPEACCFDDGTCMDLLPADCICAGGTPQGPGTVCLGDADMNGIDDACEPEVTGACCFADPPICIVTTLADCDNQGGTYMGDGTNCDDLDFNGIADECEVYTCGPTTDGTACQPFVCPVAGEVCQPQCVEFDPLTGAVKVTDCACEGVDECHVDTGAAGGRGVRAPASDPCVVLDDGTGTVTLPPAGCEYMSPEEVHEAVGNLPAGTTIELAAIHKDFICGPDGGRFPGCPPPGLTCEDDGGDLGGKVDCFESLLELQVTGALNRTLFLQAPSRVDTGPRTPGDSVQDFPTEIVALEAQLFGDPDFCTLRITAGGMFGLPSPGHTTLTALGPPGPGTSWVVDSFFDVAYQIEWQGCPGGALDGYAGTDTGTLHMETGGMPECVGGCPVGEICVDTKVVNADGKIDMCCTCEPDTPTECGPTLDETACQPFVCPIAGEVCQPQCVEFDPLTGAVKVTDCECEGVDECHVDTGAVGGRGVRDTASDPCVVPPGPPGTVTLPPAGCEYMSPEEVHEAIGNLPAGTTIELAAIHKDFICEQGAAGFPGCPPPGLCEQPGGGLGGHVDCFQSVLELHVQGTGGISNLTRTLFVPVMSQVHTGPRTPGDAVQSFPNEMYALEGQLFGDPDFCTLRITAGQHFGLPASMGHTTLTELPSGNFVVDSFFDLHYTIEFEGCPGSKLEGASGTDTLTVHMETGGVPECVGGCPPGEVCVDTQVVDLDGTVRICCTCEPEPTGGCCLGDGTCVVVTQPNCGAMGGTYLGDGTPCLGDADMNGVDDACECEPTADGTACEPLGCADAAQDCQPQCVEIDPLTGAVTITDCDCKGADDCHVDLGVGGGRGVRDPASDPCVVVDDGTGTIALPPAGCEYMSPEEVHEAIGNLPNGTVIELAGIHKDFWCNKAGGRFPGCPPPRLTCEDDGGDLGGKVDCFESVLELHVSSTGPDLLGFTRTLFVSAPSRVDTGPRTPGDSVQDFDNEMVALQGELFGDPDFCVLRVTAGSMFGLPSPGHTTLTALGPPGPGTSWVVDSFFDVAYQIEWQGCPGSQLEGYGGTDTGTLHMETGGMPECVGGCPAGEVCVDTKVVNLDGNIDMCCTCEPDVPTECGPTLDGTACEQVTCPDNGTPIPDRCQASCVSYDPATGVVTVTACECRGEDACHADSGTGGRAAVGGGNPCVVTNTGGTVTLPPDGCEYLSPEEVHEIIEGLPVPTTIELTAIHKDFWCNPQSDPFPGCPPAGVCEDVGGDLGGNVDCFDSTLELQVQGNGPPLDLFVRTLFPPVRTQVFTGPRNPGDPVQDFPTEMYRIEGELVNDPDFCTFRIEGGRYYGLPSPGHTTLTRTGGVGTDFAVDSYFDVSFRIIFEGCPGSLLEGYSGTTTGTIRMETGGAPNCVGGCPENQKCTESRVVDPDTGRLDLCCGCEAVLIPNEPGPTTGVHAVLKHRMLSIDPSTNSGPRRDVAALSVGYRVELTAMPRCALDLDQACTVDTDCDDGTTGPCVQHPDVGGVWWAQQHMDQPDGCPPKRCFAWDGVPCSEDTDCGEPEGSGVCKKYCGPTDQFSRLDAVPFFSDWSDPRFTLANLHLTDCEITPIAEYEVRACLPPGVICSNPLAVSTSLQSFLGGGFRANYGDTVGTVDPNGLYYPNYEPPDGITNVTDVEGWKRTFQNLGTTNSPQAHPTWVDLLGPGDGSPPQPQQPNGNPPNYVVNVSDLFVVQRAIQGFRWTDWGNNLNPGDCP